MAILTIDKIDFIIRDIKGGKWGGGTLHNVKMVNTSRKYSNYKLNVTNNKAPKYTK